MSEGHNANVEWIIANAINEQARGDPDALAPHIIAALEKAGYRITPATEDTALGSQPFDELTPDMASPGSGLQPLARKVAWGGRQCRIRSSSGKLATLKCAGLGVSYCLSISIRGKVESENLAERVYWVMGTVRLQEGRTIDNE
jgi:hypothetical protein